MTFAECRFVGEYFVVVCNASASNNKNIFTQNATEDGWLSLGDASHARRPAVLGWQ